MAAWNTGEKNGMWRGGRSLASNGYMLVRVDPSDPLADVRGYAYEHRLVARAKIGRDLLPGEVVHHVDGNKTNNAPSNVEVLSRAQHRAEHRIRDRGLRAPGEANRLVDCACGCGASIQRFDSHNRPRRFVSGHNIRRAS